MRPSPEDEQIAPVVAPGAGREEAAAVSTRAPEAPAKGSGPVLLTLAAGQFLMTLDSSVMNVSIATVAKDVGTTVTGVLLWVEHQMQNLAIVLDSCQSQCQSTSQYQTGLWRSGWIRHLT